ncbi:flagellar protein FlaG [Nitrosomonas sp. PY1]|uniref:flagellar protein FlaG n=1 Tax=Nitrosomonas sp. PY1 TaxID=1803906 RepID=UPI001FC8902A|nr:flagellar protein FlaG [Nitrosomonas sp. PY1]GKS68298.1 flagellar protein FlaG [Nitrosomonas sp. PY1]
MNINALNVTNVYLPPPTANTQKSATNYLQVLPPSQVKDTQSETTSSSDQDVQHAVQKIQEAVANLAHNLRFSIDEDTGRTIIKVMDVHTDEIIRQIPTKEAIEIAHTLDRVQGLLFSDKA